MPAIFNGIQGFLIFVILVVFRKRVRKLLAIKRPFGITFPNSWAAYKLDECDTVVPENRELPTRANGPFIVVANN